jgi:hypothetical protein
MSDKPIQYILPGASSLASRRMGDAAIEVMRMRRIAHELSLTKFLFFVNQIGSAAQTISPRNPYDDATRSLQCRAFGE